MNNPLRVLHVSTQNEDCGIAKYLSYFLDAMKNNDMIQNQLFPYSPNKMRFMTQDDFSHVKNQFASTLVDADIVHFQHELSFYKKPQLLELIKIAKSHNKVVIATVHTAPSAAYTAIQRPGLHPRSWLHYRRSRKTSEEFIDAIVKPLMHCDHLLVHNDASKRDLIRFGIDEKKIERIVLPVLKGATPSNTHFIGDNLKRKENDVIIGTVGFISRTKGIAETIKSLKFLPENYKLAIVGGIHPKGDASYLDELSDLILQLGLESRVFVTGFIEEDDKLAAYVNECDVCVYPYNPEYYSYVSSGALSTSLSLSKPVITYPIATFIEMNSINEVCIITKSSNYYELARSIKSADLVKAHHWSDEYAKKHTYEVESQKLMELYSKFFVKAD